MVRVFRAGTKILVTLLILVLHSGCGAASKGKSAHVQLSFASSGKKLSASSMQPLPKNLCYLVHVTGARHTKIQPEQWSCGPDVGMGWVSPRAYSAGEAVEIFVPVGFKLRFDLVGFTPHNVDAGGKAVCGELRTEYKLDGAATETKAKFFLNGTQVANMNPVKFYTALADIAPGENTVNMEIVPLLSVAVTNGMSYGAPYARADLAIPPAGCFGAGAGGGAIGNVANNAGVEQFPGASLDNSSAITSTGSDTTAQIIGASMSALILDGPSNPLNSAAGPSAKISTGFWEITGP